MAQYTVGILMPEWMVAEGTQPLMLFHVQGDDTKSAVAAAVAAAAADWELSPKDFQPAIIMNGWVWGAPLPEDAEPNPDDKEWFVTWTTSYSAPTMLEAAQRARAEQLRTAKGKRHVFRVCLQDGSGDDEEEVVVHD